MAPGGGTQKEKDKYKNATNVKELLDMIGETVQKQVHGEAKTYVQKLKGNLQHAKGSLERVSSLDTCELVKEYYDELADASGKRYPCKKLSGEMGVNRFSNTLGGQCTDQQIEGNDRNNGGACAPYRRLHLCNKNMVNMEKIATSTTTNKLLAEVCMAAKYEGNSIDTHYTEHEQTNHGFHTNICTVLARSFADIGDIVRGRDLYLGKKKNQKQTERDKLEENFKKYFQQIHDDVTKGGKTNGKKEEIETRYKKDDEDGNFFQLREDWWYANRAKVWEALTCDPRHKAEYFRQTACAGKTATDDKCRCNGDQVPTYFDYVPQYLRWFEEWAEDFCRKKKKKVENVKNKCRGFYNKEPRYCSRNGFDCEQTIYKKGYFVIDKGCINCLYACNPYVEWIDNQRKQFDTQKQKYINVINGAPVSRRRRRDARNENYDGYESKFYKELQSNGYQTVNKFLEKLSNEEICKEVKDEEGGKINFAEEHGDNSNDKKKGTFYHSDYCQPCPDCGMKWTKEDGKGKWEQKSGGKCKSGKRYKIEDDAPSTDIDVLSFGDKRDQIKSKIDTFCGVSNGEKEKLKEQWKCYEFEYVQKDKKEDEEDEDYDKDYTNIQNAGGLCILKKENKSSKEPAEIQKTFNPFFYYWVAHMLKDSIRWKKKLEKCLKNKKTCGNEQCKDNCGCFLKWVKQKKEQEWTKIKEHFKTQEAFKNKGENGEDKKLDVLMRCPDFVLQYNLREEFLKKDSTEDSSEDSSEDSQSRDEEAKEIKHLREMLQQAGVDVDDLSAFAVSCIQGLVAEQKNIMDKLLDYEERIANNCKQDCEQPQQPAGGVARSDTPTPATPSPGPATVGAEHEENAASDEDEEDEEEDEDEVEEDKDRGGEPPQEAVPDAVVDTVVTPKEGPPAPVVPPPDVCNTVKSALEDMASLQDACNLKYVKGKNYGWRCVTPSGKPGEPTSGVDTTTKSSGSGSTTTVKSGAATGGSICVPPRRRRLYVGKLHDWAKSDETTKGSKSQETGGTSSAGGTSSQSDKLPQVSTQAGTSSRAQSSNSENPQNGDQTTSSPSSNPRADGLRDAFIESAAVETFFLWDRYKKLNTKRQGVGAGAPQLQEEDDNDEEEENPQKKLQESGTIPNDFLRLMFYTLGDYKDILYSGGNNTNISGSKDTSSSNDNLKHIVLEASGNKEDMKKIQKAIDEHINSVSKPGGPPKPSGTTPQTLWDEIAPSIWKGMIYALTYKENGSDKPEVDTTVKMALFGKEDNCKEPIETYKYDQVKLKEENSGEMKTNDDTKLENFVKRPTYFRWLEEWGEEFCRKRTDKLKKLDKECRGVNNSGNPKYCSGDGYDCERKDINRNDNFVELDCSRCAEQCTYYKNWIKNKEKEYNNQKSKYEGEHGKLPNNSNGGDNNCCTEIKEKKTAADFLAALKHCKDDQSDRKEDNDDKKNNKIDFSEPLKTFSPTTYCKACPIYGVTCPTNGCKPKDEPTNQKSAEGVATPITILINDGSTDGATDGIDEKLKNCSKKYSLFKGLSKQEWKCQKKKGVYQCNLENFKNDTYFDKDIVFNEFFQRWLRYFVHDYNKLKHKIKPCINKEDGKEHKCIEGCNNKCDCVEKWLDKKSTEWEEIKSLYKQYSKISDQQIAFRVKSYFELLYFDSDYKKAQEVVENESDRYKLWGCTGRDDCSEKEKEENKNFITNLISELQKKIKTCPTQPGGKTETQCEDPPLVEEPPLDPDDHDHMHHIQQPKICPPPETPLTCVEEIAKELREEAEKSLDNIDSSLKVDRTTFNGRCKQIKKENGAPNGDDCEFKNTYKKSLDSLDQQCKGKGKERFNIGQEWKCEYIKDIGKHICIPPRREHMCLDDLNILGGHTINDSTALLQMFEKAAKREGDDIIRNLLPKNACNENVICDAMKYSFADLGDIIRGRDLFNQNRKQKGLQRRLQNAFVIIYNKLDKNNQNQYKYDFPFYYKLRSDWWDANRRDIWKAMTCNAPDDAKFLKKNPNDTSGSSSAKGIMTRHPKCGYDKEPPDYDYIPQPFRWMQEWSEYYCKALTDEIKKLNEGCKECTSGSCGSDEDGKKCEKCKTQCKYYSDFVQMWQNQFHMLSKTYTELYDKAIKNNSDGTTTAANDKSVEGPRLPRRRGKPRAPQEDDSISIEFLKQVKVKCEDPKIAGTYLDKANNCIQYKFAISSGSSDDSTYAFKNPPKEYEKACECEAPDPLDECPHTEKNKDVCNIISKETLCKNKNLNNDDDSWTSVDVKDSTGNNKGVLVPPRRRELCIKNITANFRSIEKNKEVFKTELMNCAYNEGKLLCELYKKDRDVTLQAMKYSFADYGDIVKGTDIMENYNLIKLKNKLDVLLKQNKANEILKHRENWWDKNKKRVWHAMLCGYKAAGGKIEEGDCTLPDDKTDQFLRWFREWSEHFCDRRKKLYDDVQKKCASAQCIIEYGTIHPPVCEEACTQYRDYITRKIQEYRSLLHQYNMNFKTQKAEDKNVPEYFKDKCKNKCQCLFEYIDKEKQWRHMYDSFDDNDLKKKCVCKKIKPKIIYNKKKTEDETDPEPDTPPRAPTVNPPLPGDEPFNRDILEKTIPFGVALALGSIAFLFLKVIYIVVYMYMYMCFFYMYLCGVFGYIYVCMYMCFVDIYVCLFLDIYLCICMCFIYILYICIYIRKEKNQKKEKKKKEI